MQTPKQKEQEVQIDFDSLIGEREREWESNQRNAMIEIWQ